MMNSAPATCAVTVGEAMKFRFASRRLDRLAFAARHLGLGPVSCYVRGLFVLSCDPELIDSKRPD
jgi:hypothetical protein